MSCNVNHCHTCVLEDFCSLCYGDYVANSQDQCILCKPPCKTCNNDGTCNTCFGPYNLQAANDGTCYSCQDPFCISCTSSTTDCLTCMSGYHEVDGICTQKCAVSICMACSSSNNSVCTQCMPGYYINVTTSQCELCTNAPACTACFATNPAICTACSAGFYNTFEGECLACPGYCRTCINATYCDQIKDATGQAIVNTNGVSTLVVCDQGCYSCSSTSPTSCVECMPGYTMVSATPNAVAHCIACQGNCLTCTSDALSTCTSCFSGYYLKDNACVGCSNGCLSCG